MEESKYPEMKESVKVIKNKRKKRITKDEKLLNDICGEYSHPNLDKKIEYVKRRIYGTRGDINTQKEYLKQYKLYLSYRK